MWTIAGQQTENWHSLKKVFFRIISVVPSQTELLYDLGLDNEVIGITKFCIHPNEWFRSKPRVGGTKTLHIDQIRSLQPDLVLANKEENTKEDILAISEFCPVWVSDIESIPDALHMIREIGILTGRAFKADEIARDIEQGFRTIQPFRAKAAYLIWKDPYMAAGGKTFINAMMKQAGLKNIYENEERYPTVNLAELNQNALELLLLSSEPYPFKMKDLKDLNEILPQIKIVLVDGEMFSWYGSRMREFPDYLAKQLFSQLTK